MSKDAPCANGRSAVSFTVDVRTAAIRANSRQEYFFFAHVQRKNTRRKTLWNIVFQVGRLIQSVASHHREDWHECFGFDGLDLARHFNQSWRHIRTCGHAFCYRFAAFCSRSLTNVEGHDRNGCKPRAFEPLKVCARLRIIGSQATGLINDAAVRQCWRWCRSHSKSETP